MRIAAVAMLVVVASGTSQPLSADDPLAGVGSLILSGRAAEARTKLTEVLSKAEQSKDERREATCRYFLGMAEANLGNHDASRQQLDEARKSFLALNDRFGLATVLFALAQVERDTGRTEQAISLLEQTLARLEEIHGSDLPLEPDTLILMAATFGAPPEDMQAFPIEAVRPLLMIMLAALTRADLGAALVEAGHLERAEVELQQARRDAEPLGGFLDAALDSASGDLRMRQWRFDEARDHYRKAIYGTEALIPFIPKLPANVTIEILLKLTEIDLLSGRPNDALRWSERFVALASGPPVQQWHAASLHYRGIVFLRANRFDSAATVLAEAATIAARSGDALREASIRIDLGGVELLRRQPASAIANLEKAVELLQPVAPPDVQRSAWITLAEALMLSGGNDAPRAVFARLGPLAAKSWFPPAKALLEAVETSGEPRVDSTKGLSVEARRDLRQFMEQQIASVIGMPESLARQILLSMVLAIRGRTAFLQGDLADAHDLWTRALQSYPAAGYRNELLAAIGATHWLRGNWREGLRFVTSAAKGLGWIGDVSVEEQLTAFTGSDRRWYFELAIHALIEQGHVEKAFESAERAGAWEARELLGANRLDHGSGVDADLLHHAETLRIQLLEYDRQTAFRSQQIRSLIKPEDVQRARQRYEELLRRLSSSRPDYVSTVRPEPADVGAVREAIPADATLVRYFVSRQEGIHAWVLDRRRVEHVLLPLRAVEDDFDLLIAPLKAKVRSRALVIIPHGELHRVPFASYLADDYALTCTPSASRLRFSREPCPAVQP